MEQGSGEEVRCKIEDLGQDEESGRWDLDHFFTNFQHLNLNTSLKCN